MQKLALMVENPSWMVPSMDPGPALEGRQDFMEVKTHPKRQECDEELKAAGKEERPAGEEMTEGRKPGSSVCKT